ncbi:MAG TPA: TlpA disulfide reductase family protein [Pseudomonadales bacterium]
MLVLLAPLSRTQAVTAVVGPQGNDPNTAGSADLIGRPAPEFSLPSLDPANDPVQLREHRGKVVYLDFWSSWCAPCRRAMPYLDELRSRFSREDFEVVGINVDPIVEDARRFLEQVPVSYPVASDPEGRVADRFGIAVLPAVVVVDRSGTVRAMLRGAAVEEQGELRAKLTKLIGEREVQ